MTTLQASELNQIVFNTFATSHEPVIINDNDKQMGIYFSMEDLEKVLMLQSSIKEQINAGILNGLEDVKQGRVSSSGESHKKQILERLQNEI